MISQILNEVTLPVELFPIDGISFEQTHAFGNRRVGQ